MNDRHSVAVWSIIDDIGGSNKPRTVNQEVDCKLDVLTFSWMDGWMLTVYYVVLDS